MEIVLVAAMAKNRVIGRQGGLPWHIPEELRRFQALTMGHSLIMGRRTFESIGRPLPGRRTVVVSRRPGYQAAGCLVAASLEAALALCREEALVFIAGGGQIYQEALPLAHTLFLSILDREAEGDVLFPEFDPGSFRTIREERVEGEEPYTFVVLQRPP
jgi:dihydrofolate reductase